MLGAGRGFGCVGPDGKWQASSLVLPLGQKLAWISMVLVTKARRQGGVGTCLLKRCIEEVRSADAVAGLDATELGRPSICRWVFAISIRSRAGTSIVCRTRLSVRHRRRVAADRVDRPARAGAVRSPPDRNGAAHDPGASRVAPTGPCLDCGGHGRQDRGLRPGPRGQAGDVARPRGGRQRRDRAGADRRGGAAADGAFIIDVPDGASSAAAWLQAQGAVTPRGYMRMTLGEARDSTIPLMSSRSPAPNWASPLSSAGKVIFLSVSFRSSSAIVGCGSVLHSSNPPL